tara:strand:- start:2084 stop:3613 length:1530 start_codon:yes stop_codon:yes gene_type:complete
MKKISKLINFSDLEKKFSKYKSKKKIIVHCHGVFDLLHIGHIKHFKEAKKLGDVLIVTITADNFVNKGLNRPYFNQIFRAEAISSLEFVDHISIIEDKSADKAIMQIKPNFYCKGEDYKNLKQDITGKINNEKKTVEKYGGKIYFTSEITFSSSTLLNSSFNILNRDQNLFLEKLKRKFDFETIKKIIKQSSKSNGLVIGEAIIDEYTFCDVIGKSGKEPVLVYRDLKTDLYLGGSIAISNHLSGFCNKVNLVSMLGEKKEHLNFIKKNINKNINFKFINKIKSPTIIKKRFIDKNNSNKLLGLYKFNDEELNIKNEKQLLLILKKQITKSDFIVVSDYGHGFLNNNVISFLLKKNIFTSINAQINASNVGFHSLKRFSKSNLIVINETELRHESRSRDGNLDELIIKLSSKLNIQYLIVTSGNSGVKLFNKKTKKMHYCPAFANKIVDKIGAGDTLLAVITLLLYNKCDIDLSLFISSLCAAETVESIGNSNSVIANNILRKIDHMLK